MAMATLSLPPCGVKPLSLSINGMRYSSLSSSRPIRSLNRCNASLFSSSTGAMFTTNSPIRPSVMSHNSRKWRRGNLVICEAGTGKKPDQAEKRMRQNEKRRLRNKSRKSEIRTRMRRVLGSLMALRKKKDATPEDIIPIEKLISITYSKIDKAVRKGVLNKNTGSHRKSRMARLKKAILMFRGWYTPAPEKTEVENVTA